MTKESLSQQLERADGDAKKHAPISVKPLSRQLDLADTDANVDPRGGTSRGQINTDAVASASRDIREAVPVSAQLQRADCDASTPPRPGSGRGTQNKAAVAQAGKDTLKNR